MPLIMSSITDGKAAVSWNFTQKQAEELAGKLNQ